MSARIGIASTRSKFGIGTPARRLNSKSHGALTGFHNLAQIQPSAVADLILLTDLRSQNAREVLGVVAIQLGFTAPYLVHKKASSGHNVGSY